MNTIETPRSHALGGAGVAIGYDATLMWVNPASVAGLPNTTASLGGRQGFLDGMTGQGVYAMPFEPGTAAVGAVYDDAGMVTMNALDGTSRTVRARTDFLGALAYGQDLPPSVNIGATVKFANSTLAEEFSASAFAIDLGCQLRLGEKSKVGLSIQNVGGGVKYSEDSIPSPRVVRLGYALGFRIDPAGEEHGLPKGTVLWVADLEHTGDEAFWHAGCEYVWNDVLVLRVGGSAGRTRQLGVLAAGLGFRSGKLLADYETTIKIDYSVQLTSSELGTPQMACLTAVF